MLGLNLPINKVQYIWCVLYCASYYPWYADDLLSGGHEGSIQSGVFLRNIFDNVLTVIDGSQYVSQADDFNMA